MSTCYIHCRSIFEHSSKLSFIFLTKTFSAIVGDDLLEFHQAVVSTLRDADDAPVPLDPAPLPPIQPIQPNNPLLTHTSEDMARLCETHNDFGTDHEDEADTGKKTVEQIERKKNDVSMCPKKNFYLNRRNCFLFFQCIYITSTYDSLKHKKYFALSL